MNARRATIKEPLPVEDERTASEVEADEQAAENDKTQEPYVEPEADVEPEPEGWHPGNACLTCGNKKPRLTVNWGNGCDQCLVADED